MLHKKKSKQIDDFGFIEIQWLITYRKTGYIRPASYVRKQIEILLEGFDHGVVQTQRKELASFLAKNKIKTTTQKNTTCFIFSRIFTCEIS